MPKLPSFDPKALVKTEERPGTDTAWYQADPAVVYPATIARIREVIKSGEFPNELIDNSVPEEADPRGAARTLLGIARAIPGEAFKWALQEHDRFYRNYAQSEIDLRKKALEVARLWFTQALHVAHGGNGTPMGIHITNNPAYKL